MCVSRSVLSDPMDHNPPASSVHGILQARILEWVANFFSIKTITVEHLTKQRTLLSVGPVKLRGSHKYSADVGVKI